MNDQTKTKEELISELQELRQENYSLQEGSKLTELKNEVSNLLLKVAIVDNMSEGVLLVRTNDGVIIYANPSIERMFKVAPNELIGMPISTVNAPTDRNPEEVASEIILHLNTNGYWQGEIQNIRMDGTTFWSHAVVSTFEHPKFGNVWIAIHQDITDSKQLKEILNEKKIHLRDSLELAKLGSYRIDLPTQTIFLSPEMASLFGCEYKAIKLPLEEYRKRFYLPADLEKASKLANSAYTSGTPLNIDSRVIRSDGQMIWVQARSKPMSNGTTILGIVQDITERVQAERALETSENEFELLAESMPQIVWVTRSDGWNIYFNQQWVDYTGLSLEESYGHGWNKPFHPDDQQRARDAWQNAIKNNGKYSLECQLRGKDGIYRWWLIRGIPVIDLNGNILKWFGTCTDIHDIKLVERELIKAKEKAEESENKYKTLFEANTDGITIFRLVGEESPPVIMDMNENAHNMLGYSKDEMLALNPDVLEINITKEKLEKRVYELKTKGFLNFETTLRHKNGCDVNVEIKALIISYKDQPTLMNIVRDISERKLADQELIKAKEKAEESDRLKSAFLANMSHEVRTPMNGIIGFANLLKDSKLSGEEQHEYITIIEKSGARMLNIINDIIDISKIESGQMKLNIVDSNVNDQIEYLYTFFKPEVEHKGMQLVFKNSLLSKESIIQTDREKVFAILTNLIKNAIKYSDKGTIEFGYNLKSKEPAELEFFVMDNGIGIPKDRQEAIFARFIQADIGDKRAFDGAGLGLAITKSYVEMLGGKIWVDSEQGKGSIFYFTLPYNPKFKEIDTSASNVVYNEIINLNKKLKILIAEDDEISEKLLSNAMIKLNKEVLKVKSGIEAVDACRNNLDIDLVLMDIQMPRMDGYEATRLIRQFNMDIIIIAQTAYGLSGDREKAIESGCNDYISKPINTSKLMELIQKYFT